MDVTGYRKIARAVALLALAVVILGAYVRLTDAGLGCPDWPGCYGRLTVGAVMQDIDAAQQAYPERPVEPGKAWREMLHRYLAGLLGLAVLLLAVLAWRNRHAAGQPVALPLALLVLVVFQALLGMWTVTLLLKPVVVMAHLLGGMATLALLWWLSLPPPGGRSSSHRLAGSAAAALALLAVQIALGGWTSTNYAALACPDFPTCQGSWWPEMDFAEGFRPWRGLGVDYEGGVLHNSARVAVHVTHRIGALITLLVLAALAVAVWRSDADTRARRAALLMAAALLAQITIGILIVLRGLPLSLATAHNGVAAVLLLTLVTLNRSLRPGRSAILSPS
jgi:cytochrome c oxidase assembly protein subunit 15